MNQDRRLPFAARGWTALLLLLGLLVCLPAQAQQTASFTENETELDFPNTLTFSIRVSADEPVTALALEYGTDADRCVRSLGHQPVEIDPGKAVDASWTWDFIDSGNLPMGAQVWWEWVATLESGASARSPRQSLSVVDQRYTWEQTGRDEADPTSVNVWFHDTSPSFARSIAQIGQKALQQLQADFGVTPARPVQIVLYNTTEEVFESGLYMTEWVGAYTVVEYSLVIIGAAPADTAWAKEVIYHELAHLASGQLSANCLAVALPTWLSEGFSMYMEGGVVRSEQAKVKQALEDGSLPALRTLAAGFSAVSAEASLSYAQSGMVFDYLMKEYGAEQVVAIFQAIQAGALAEDALRQVIGLDVDGLDNAWRTSLGYVPQQALASATATPLPTAISTLPLMAPYGPSPTPSLTATPAPPTSTPAPATSTPAAVEPEQSQPASKGGGIPCGGSSALILVLLALYLVPRLSALGGSR
jgi:hypothetical protein